MELVTGAMGTLPLKVLELLHGEYKLQKGARADVESLSRELESVHASLRRVATVPWDELDDLMKVWACEVREASYDMEDVIDDFLVRVGGPEPRFLEKMGRLFHLRKAKARRDLTGAVQDIRLQLREISERRDRYKIDDIAVARPATARVDPRLSALYTEASQLVGIDEPRDELMKMLSVGDKQETKIVSVVGFGGLGKTTLAKAVYDKVSLHFDCRAFVPVGQNPDPRKVLRDIINDISVNKNTNITFDHDKARSTLVDPRALDERQLINILRVYLEGKRYLIVLDDIWETKIWGTIQNAFVDSNCGSRIITTTRKSHVSKEIGEVYQIKELSDKNSKKLFNMKAFRGMEKCHFSAHGLDEVSDKIIRKCSGVPLAIVTIASVLANKPPEEWSNVYDSIGFGLDGDEQSMTKILSFSYYDMPCHLRTCLLYLSIFIEEDLIEERDLILRWMAEGFIQQENGKGFLEIGLSYLHELIDRSMVIPTEDKGSGLLDGCRVHDMILRFIRDLSSKENFAHVLVDKQWPPAQDNIRRLSLQMLKGEISYKSMVQVRSYNVTICHTQEMPQLSSFKVLRVLALEFVVIGKEGYSLKHITKLIHLRYLRITHTPARKLPKKIGRLKFLQTLILSDTGIEELPASVRQLTQLLCLRVDKRISVPGWIGELTSLVELEMYHEMSKMVEEPFSVVGPELYRGVDNKCSAEWFVKELGKLTNLRFLMTAVNLKNNGQGDDFLESLRKQKKIQAIDISFPSVFLEMDVATMEPSFALSSDLRVLNLFNMQFPRLPTWINAQDLPNLCQLTLVVSEENEEDLKTLGRFRGLLRLVLIIIRSRRSKLASCGCAGFQNLRSFNVIVQLRFGQGAMPRLESINFSIPVAELKDAGIGLEFGLQNLSALRSVSVNLDCTNACLTEVQEAEAVLKRELDIHPNRPACEISKTDEDKMEPADAGSRKFNQLMYKGLKAITLSADIAVQQDRYSSLYNEAAEMASSMPKEHSTVAKVALLRKQIADPVVPKEASDVPWDHAEVMEVIQEEERLLETYNIEIQRVTAIVEELKAGLSPQQVQMDHLPAVTDQEVTKNCRAGSMMDMQTTQDNNSPLLADVGSLNITDGDYLELDYSMFDVEADEDLMAVPSSSLPEAATASFTDEMSADRSKALQELYNALTSQGSRDQLLAGSSDLESIFTVAAPLLQSKTITSIQEVLQLPKKKAEIDGAQERLRRREIQEQKLRTLTADAKLKKQQHDKLVSAYKENTALVLQEKARLENLKKALSLSEEKVNQLTAESATLQSSLAEQRKSMMDAVAAHKAQKANTNIPGSRVEDESIIASVDSTIAAAILAISEEMGSCK